jgi:cellulose synthase/poly-beta-1,6-N-acetylglucosamine synthase-like glycosyltransferase
VYVKRGEINPNVTLIIIVHNEEKVIKKRIKDALALDYPREKLEIIVASDGATDKTDVIVESMSKEDNRIKLFKTEGGGKSFTQNKVIPYAKGEIIVLTDAQTMFHKDAVKSLTHNFADKAVGCVSGRLMIKNEDNSISEGHSFYWKYEIFLRSLESKVGTFHTATGSIMAFRKSLFRPFEVEYGDDCIIPLDIIAQGYRVIHEDNAVAYDTFPSTIERELKTRIRMTLRNITGTFSKFHLLNPFRFPLISVSILSHKIFRWLTPYFMIVLFISNYLLLKESSFYKITLYCQLIFYFFGVVGFVAERNSYRIPIASQAFSFLLANIGFFFGVLKALFGQKIVAYRN